MHTNLADFMRGTADGERAQAIIAACVHCGFCNATCPTYQILGDERDGPRGRIYLIKHMLEGGAPGTSTQTHLDRCLTCRSCETTCPSGVQYSHLLDIGRKVVEQQVPRSWRQRALRQVLTQVLPRREWISPILTLGYFLRPILPESWQQKLPRLRGKVAGWAEISPIQPKAHHTRRMLLLEGCVQPGMAPNINAATMRVFDALGVQVVVAAKAGCCGALRHHLNQQEAALDDMRQNIDAWWPYMQTTPVQPSAGAALPVEAILMTASGCGVTVKDYGYLLAHDPSYAEKAAHISALTRDVGEVLVGFFEPLREKIRQKREDGNSAMATLPVLAYHPPCTLQHGQQLRGQVEGLLRGLGFVLRLPQDSHLCCGSAGAYSILQADIAKTLRDEKLRHLHALAPAGIVSGNIGCLAHLQSGTELPVRHWIEWVDRVLV